MAQIINLQDLYSITDHDSPNFCLCHNREYGKQEELRSAHIRTLQIKS